MVSPGFSFAAQPDSNNLASSYLMDVSFLRKETCADLKFNVHPFRCFEYCWPAALQEGNIERSVDLYVY